MVGAVKSAITPLVVMRPIELPLTLVNHRAPSGPLQIDTGPEIRGDLKFEIDPEVVIRPIELFLRLVNHNAPSGPTVMTFGPEMLGAT